MRLGTILCVVSLLAACGTKGDDDSGGSAASGASGSAGTEGTADSSGTTTTAGSASGGSGGGVDGHGYIKVQLRRADSESESPFIGTEAVQLTLDYSACVDEFYTTQPNWAQDGVDGAPVFAAFADPDHAAYLCAQTDASRPAAACDVTEIAQDVTGDVGRLLNRYAINEDDIEDKILFFGPVPCAELTVCEPILSATGASGNGFGTGGTKLWGTTSFPQRDGVCGQGLPIELKIGK